MNSQLDETPMEEYLDQICAEFGDLPADWRAAQREELHGHLRAMAEACSESGSEPDQAVREALRQFGEPSEVGRAMARKYWPSDLRSDSFLFAFATASVWLFGLVGTTSYVLRLGLIWYLSTGPLLTHRADFSIFYQALSGFAVLAPPLVAGCMTGLATPKHSVLAMLVAVPLFCGVLGCIGNGNHGYVGLMVKNCIANMLLGGFAAHVVSRWLLRKKPPLARLISFWREASL